MGKETISLIEIKTAQAQSYEFAFKKNKAGPKCSVNFCNWKLEQ